MKWLVGRQETVEDRDDCARCDFGRRELPEDEAKPVAPAHRALDRAHLVENEPAADAHGDVFAADTKLPREEPGAVQALADAFVFDKRVWRFRNATAFEIAWRTYDRQLLRCPQ